MINATLRSFRRLL